MPPDIETVENRWDILYRDYPDVYEAFARVPKTPTWDEVIGQRYDLSQSTVVDVGAGTGLSTFKLARLAREVIGVEPEEAMREIAVAKASEQGLANLHFVDGAAEALPLADVSVDVVAAITLASLYYTHDVRAFAAEAERVLCPSGWVISVNIAPRWYGGDLAPVIYAKPRSRMPGQTTRDRVFKALGYDYFDYFATQDYGTTKHIVATYGFIFGRAAIDHLRATGQTVITWKIRVHTKQV